MGASRRGGRGRATRARRAAGGDQALLDAAIAARARSHSPYSRFSVGAALRAASGVVYLGCNVECASYGLTTCAERVALQTAVAAGERRFEAVAIVGGPHGAAPDPGVSPCGACRQVLAEFGLGLRVILPSTGGRHVVMALGDLLPRSFGPADLGIESRLEVAPAAPRTRRRS